MGLGSNLDDPAGTASGPEANLKRALKKLEALEGIALGPCSDTFFTEPQGVKGQPWFANCVVRLDVTPQPPRIPEEGTRAPCATKTDSPTENTALALKLLRDMLAVEREMGRVRPDPASLANLPEQERERARFGPRVIDLDLLTFEGVQCAAPEMVLPHPRMTDRAFVLIPLQQIAPDLELAGGMTAAQHLARLKYALDDNYISQ